MVELQKDTRVLLGHSEPAPVPFLVGTRHHSNLPKHSSVSHLLTRYLSHVSYTTRSCVRRAGGGRLLVGLCGSAAAGKSTLAQLLCAACGVLWGSSSVACVSMDAYSFPNTYLSAEPAEHLGRPCTLKDIKGLPETLDSASFLRDLNHLRHPSVHNIMLPAYSRDLHDPVPDCVAVAPDCRVVIVEGAASFHKAIHPQLT